MGNNAPTIATPRRPYLFHLPSEVFPLIYDVYPKSVFITHPRGVALENDLRLIGGRIRQVRKQQGLRLSDLSNSAQCSESMLSKIENGKVTPSLATLRNIAKALDTRISTLISEESDSCMVVHAGDREMVCIKHDPDIEAARIIPSGSRRTLDAYVLKIPAGSTFNDGFPRDGEMLGYVVDGDIALGTSGEEHALSVGDAFHAHPKMQYVCRNDGNSMATLLLVSIMPGL
ncbi:helix-turn-helix domain-containing protein [Oceanidesulfovibrio marinus]|uniref:HTH cro/C1-type domain-containing protein n=1 Tax=Oceanidesulfovibrio marinus TaxID=370038 RepID=A0A6P1ZDQ1_9BACT|nr:helix-turn-helix transcriptional regulator [Oceanidesulfovibrio marinus]TVM31767.1 hypothetical protein DQK91_17695 [Oceanidesulfovibrio marinus]